MENWTPDEARGRYVVLVMSAVMRRKAQMGWVEERTGQL